MCRKNLGNSTELHLLATCPWLELIFRQLQGQPLAVGFCLPPRRLNGWITRLRRRCSNRGPLGVSRLDSISRTMQTDKMSNMMTRCKCNKLLRLNEIILI